jgi:hypothetical protein
MSKDRVIFKLIPDDPQKGQVIAFLPDSLAETGCIWSYMHVGQHGEADLGFYHACKPARPEQYQELLAELISIGYDPVIKQRITHRKEK